MDVARVELAVKVDGTRCGRRFSRVSVALGRNGR